MPIKKFLGVSGAVAITLLTAQAAVAQNAPRERNGADRAPGAARGDARRQRQQPPAAPSAEEIISAAQSHLTAAGVDCQVTEAVNPGMNADQAQVFEAACASAPGYILLASTPPQVYNCLELAGQAETARLRDPNAVPGQQCALPANQNGLAVIGGYAHDAGLACTAEQAAAIGTGPAGGLVYEVSCAEGPGYWLEKVETGWKTTPCWDQALSPTTCRYTSAAKALASWQGVLAGSPAADCDVQQGRRVGQDAQGLTVYEIKCAVGDGYFVRIDADWKAQKFDPCATSQHIGGGCTLTPAPAAEVDDKG